MGGNLVNYPDNVRTPTANLTTAKLLLNSVVSVVSTPQAKFIVSDIKDFYLNTKMARYEYMWQFPITLIPQIITQYKLLSWFTMATFTWRSAKEWMGYQKQAY
jgi:hypothetical protein